MKEAFTTLRWTVRPRGRSAGVAVLALALWCTGRPLAGAQAPAKPPPPPALNPVVADPYLSREKGLRAMSQGLYKVAVQFFKEYRAATAFKEPDFADATILLARAHAGLKAYNNVIEDLDYHRQKSPGNLEPYYRNALLYWRAAALRGRGDLAGAAAVAGPLLKNLTDPELRRLTLQLLSEVAILRKQWAEAETHLRALLADFPDAPGSRKARIDLITVFLATGQTDLADAALAGLEKNLSPDEARNVARIKVLIETRKNQLDQALADYGKIAPERPKQADPEWWLMTSELAAALFRAGRLEQALEILPQVLRLAPTEDQRADTMLRMAEAQISLHKTDDAVQTLESFKKTFPQRPEIVPVMIRLAELLREAGKPLAAARYFAEIMGRDNAPIGFRYRAAMSRGWCLREADQPEEAGKAFLAAEKLGITKTQKARGVFLAADTAFSVSNFATAATLYAHVADTYPHSEYAEEARFRQARSTFKLRKFAAAAEIYKAFLGQFPESILRSDALLEYGIALREAAKTPDEYLAAMKELRHFVEKYPASKKAPRALMEAYEAAMGAGDTDTAIALLTEVINRKEPSDLYPHALYQRAMVQFRTGQDDHAVADAMAFLEKYADLPLAPDIMLQLGDYYANSGDFEHAKEYFAMLASKHPQSALAPAALYEAALCSYRLELPGSATLLLDQLLALKDPTPKKETLAQAQLLYGDILAKQEQYEKALEHFAAAHDLGGDSRLGLAALGRQGEMLYSLAGTDKERLPEAIQCFTTLTTGRSTPADLWEIAMYNLAKCYELAGDTEKALKAYLDIFYQYEHDRTQNKRRNTFYLARAIYDAAHLLELSGKPGDLRRAATLYEYLANMELPTAADARRRAQQIRATHDLNR